MKETCCPSYFFAFNGRERTGRYSANTLASQHITDIKEAVEGISTPQNSINDQVLVHNSPVFGLEGRLPGLKKDV